MLSNKKYWNTVEMYFLYYFFLTMLVNPLKNLKFKITVYTFFGLRH